MNFHMYMSVWIHIHRCVEGRGSHQMSFSVIFHLFFLLKQDHKLKKELTYLGNTSGNKTRRILLFPYQYWDYRCTSLGLVFVLGAGNLNSGPWAGEVNTLLNEPSIQTPCSEF